MILGGLVDEAVCAGARQDEACKVIGLDPRTLQRWRSGGIGDDRRAGPKEPPRNKLSSAERTRIVQVANSPEYRDLSPKQIVPRLADEGIYLASESTFYRTLRAEGQMVHREPSRAPTVGGRPDQHVATGPNQVWSWDITYLRTPIRGVFLYLYVVVDVWSRKLVGWTVQEEESSEHASAMIEGACAREGIQREQLVLHSDNGGPMKGATLVATLQLLGVLTSFSRPRVSNDNPFSESLFRTAKYRPEYPRGPFASLEVARRWVTWFVSWYNTEHRHSAIRFVTPEQRHAGLEAEILANRCRVYDAARKRRPERWAADTRDWSPVETVTLNPQPSTPAEVAA
jgi:transposase InsO family protein